MLVPLTYSIISQFQFSTALVSADKHYLWKLHFPVCPSSLSSYLALPLNCIYWAKVKSPDFPLSVLLLDFRGRYGTTHTLLMCSCSWTIGMNVFCLVPPLIPEWYSTLSILNTFWLHKTFCGVLKPRVWQVFSCPLHQLKLFSTSKSNHLVGTLPCGLISTILFLSLSLTPSSSFSSPPPSGSLLKSKQICPFS